MGFGPFSQLQPNGPDIEILHYKKVTRMREALCELNYMQISIYVCKPNHG